MPGNAGWIGSIADLFARGGPVVVILVAMSTVALTVIVYKLWQFKAPGVGRHRALSDAVAAWDRGAPAVAAEYLNTSSSYLKPVVELGLSHRVDGDRLEAEAETRLARLETGFRVLDSVAQLAPLLGLFGTVLGMISAFQALQEAGSQVDPAALAGGIWVALLTTAVGLAVAMPTTLMLNWFEGRIESDRVFAIKAIRTLVSPAHRAAHSGPAAPEVPHA